MPAPLLEVRNVSKSFPGVKALERVSLRLERGEALAVIGENGAGKSTLMKILAGVQSPDEGEILVEEEPVSIPSVRRATELGVALIHQELNMAGNLDIGANIFLGREPRRLGLIDFAAIYRQSREVLARVGLNLSPRTRVGTLPIGQQQLVEIAKALSANARILIMDEPTSSLSSGETARLFEVIRDLKAKGVSIVYISHRLGEVKEVCDRVTVLRDGKNAGELSRDEVDHDRMVRLMVGRDLSQFYVRKPHQPGEVMLEVKDLRVPGRSRHAINFAVRAGEIVGMAGLVGAGRTELLRVLFGVDQAEGGEIRVADQRIVPQSPRDAIRAGLALVPEDRKEQGLVLEMAVRHNISLASLRRDQTVGFRNGGKERSAAREMIAKLNIKTPSQEQIVQYLSGGNQQKVVLGKWLNIRPRVLLLDEPTRGVDVGAKREIYIIMEDLAAAGVAILFVSSEMEEILGMSDRTLVMHEGRLTGELGREELSEEAVMHLATGKTKHPGAAA
ncbi:MAG: sugar ABC transporter ATP-binding protein [Planctomycetes bacterium]|nr:sugar ABC transporter ATP-binding protein [Planctomycetota bacterium]